MAKKTKKKGGTPISPQQARNWWQQLHQYRHQYGDANFQKYSGQYDWYMNNAAKMNKSIDPNTMMKDSKFLQDGAGALNQLLMAPMSAGQAAMVEGVEAAKGNDYDFSNSLDFTKQRKPSDTFLKNSGGVTKFAGDMLLDPTLIGSMGAGLLKKGAGKSIPIKIGQMHPDAFYTGKKIKLDKPRKMTQEAFDGLNWVNKRYDAYKGDKLDIRSGRPEVQFHTPNSHTDVDKYRGWVYSVPQSSPAKLDFHKGVVDEVFEGQGNIYNKLYLDQTSPKIGSTAVHEGTHWKTGSNWGIDRQTKHTIKQNANKEAGPYLTDPTEIHARLNEVRYAVAPDNPHFNFKDRESFDKHFDESWKYIQDRGSEVNKAAKQGIKYIPEDPDTFEKNWTAYELAKVSNGNKDLLWKWNKLLPSAAGLGTTQINNMRKNKKKKYNKGGLLGDPPEYSTPVDNTRVLQALMQMQNVQINPEPQRVYPNSGYTEYLGAAPQNNQPSVSKLPVRMERNNYPSGSYDEGMTSYNFGGVLSGIGAGASLIPGLQPVGMALGALGSVASGIESTRPTDYNPYTYSYASGGQMKQVGGSGAQKVNAHQAGTDTVSLPNAKVDNNEVIDGDKVFSDDLGFAKIAESLLKNDPESRKVSKARARNKKMLKSDPYNSMLKKTQKHLSEVRTKSDELFELQEKLATQMGLRDQNGQPTQDGAQPAMRYGGKMKYNWGGVNTDPPHGIILPPGVPGSSFVPRYNSNPHQAEPAPRMPLPIGIPGMNTSTGISPWMDPANNDYSAIDSQVSNFNKNSGINPFDLVGKRSVGGLDPLSPFMDDNYVRPPFADADIEAFNTTQASTSKAKGKSSRSKSTPITNPVVTPPVSGYDDPNNSAGYGHSSTNISPNSVEGSIDLLSSLGTFKDVRGLNRTMQAIDNPTLKPVTPMQPQSNRTVGDAINVNFPGKEKTGITGDMMQNFSALAQAAIGQMGKMKEPLRQHRSPITRQQVDPSRALMENQYAFNNASNQISNSSSTGNRQANLQQALAAMIRGNNQINSQYDNQNEQLRTQYEQRLAQREAQNLNRYDRNYENIQRNQAQTRTNAVIAAGDIGRMGQAKVAQAQAIENRQMDEAMLKMMMEMFGSSQHSDFSAFFKNQNS